MAFDRSRVIAVAENEVGYLEKKTADLKYLYDKTANAGSNTNAAGQQNATPQPAQPAATTDHPAPATPQQQPQQAPPAKPVVAQPQNQGGLDEDFQ